MKLISDIINELMDYGTPISSALLKTKVLAARTHSKGLLEWVNGELNGYEEQATLPTYRITSGILSGNYMNGQWQYSNTGIPISHLTKEECENLTEIIIRDSLSAIEKLITQKDIKISISSQQKTYLEQTIRGIGNPYFQILNVHLDIPASFLTNILASVRSKLLDFMLELENQFDHITEINDLKSKSAIITQIMNTTINNNGDGNVVNTGANSSINATITITKGNKKHLAKTLKDNGVNNEDVIELLTVIDTEQPDGNNFGSKVNEWMKKMLAKSIDKTWQIGIGAAGTLLADALKAYYG